MCMYVRDLKYCLCFLQLYLTSVMFFFPLAEANCFVSVIVNVLLFSLSVYLVPYFLFILLANRPDRILQVN